ncbi:DNA polymerase I [bacterium]|nr:DNA polymerase I [bacterium]
MPTLYLIDGNSFLYRAFYAIRGLSASDGTPTNAIFGFTSMIMKLINEKKPDFFAIVFDAPGPTHRHELYDQYKAHRSAMPDELRSQIPVIKEIIDALKIPTMQMQGYEADDILGTLAVRAGSQGMEVFIATGDKDMCQVVGPNVRLYDTMKGNTTEEKDIVERYGITPSQFPEVLALMGDASDNIPGAPGIGEKTAVKLLKEYGNLETLINECANIKNTKARNAVSDNIDNIRLSLQLATIPTDLDVGMEIADLKPGEPDRGRLLEYFRRYELHSLVKLLPAEAAGQVPEMVTHEAQYEALLDAEALSRALGEIKDILAIDTETTSKDPIAAELVGISFATTGDRAYYVPIAHKYEGAPVQLSMKEVLKQMTPILENPGIIKSGHNIKYDFIVLQNAGVRMRGIGYDTMVASYLLNPNKPGHGLDATALEQLGVQMISFKDVVTKGMKDFSEVAIETATSYSGEDSAVTYRLMEKFRPMIMEEGLDKLFNDMEIPLIEVLADMETAGIKLDSDKMNKFSVKMGKELASIEQRIYFLAGEEFNINSPKQLQVVLFDNLGLKPLKKTKTGYSTNIDVLEQLALVHELPQEIIEYRGLSKLKNTYVDALPRLVNERTGRIHTSFNQTVTATGRLSSSEPNMQNIPVRGSWGPKIRETFIAEKGCMILASDYSQIELRIFAHLSGDPVMVDVFKNDGDIHTATACGLFGVAPELVTKDMRRRAKTVNFGVVYGISPYGLSNQLGIPVDEARNYIDTYFTRFCGVKKYIDELIEDTSKKGYITTIFGRKRAIPELMSSNGNTRQFGERLATNSPIQGSAADIIKVAMIKISKRLKEEKMNARMLLQVHDELLFEVPEAEIDSVRQLVREEMEGVIKLKVPLKVDIGAGVNWAEAH